jgi:hypothetical protein
VGDWQCELAGVDLLYLQPAAGPFLKRLTLQADGTAHLTPTGAPVPGAPPPPVPPFPTTWELSPDRVLSLLIPVPPMPEYEIPDWTKEALRYAVLAVTDLSLALSDRPFDGETIFVLRRINREEYDHRRAAEYGHALESLQKLAGGTE